MCKNSRVSEARQEEEGKGKKIRISREEKRVTKRSRKERGGMKEERKRRRRKGEGNKIMRK